VTPDCYEWCADRLRDCATLVIPDGVRPVLEASIAQLFNSEKVVLDAVKCKQIHFARFEVAWAAFEALRT
tara:strand:+ start:1879 stop:2088 length:210 start_codon:yes stop_codon:yes gene_type:complete